jgi:histidine triad (HIT) family protein
MKTSEAAEQVGLFDPDVTDRETQEARSHTPRGSKKPCAFCRIAADREPAFEVYRDAGIVAFLDTRPVFSGHVLMIPVVHVQTYDEMPSELAGEWLATSQRLQIATERAARADGSLMIINNVISQSVPHLHLHLIPRRKKDGLRLWLGPRQPYASDDEAMAVAHGIRRELEALAIPGR